MSTDLVPSEAALPATPVVDQGQPGRALTVFARNPQEMSIAQAQLVTWAADKNAEVTRDRDELQENFDTATRNGWGYSSIGRQLGKAKKRLSFYEKIKAALDAGYCIVPGFPIDVFAIRTDKSAPTGNVRIVDTPPLRSPRIEDQRSESPPLGEGAYVSPQAATRERRHSLPDEAGKIPHRTEITAWADAFREVDFPFTFAQPAVLHATAQAMAARIFDELGVSPTRERRAAGDPMVIGRIYAPGYPRWQREQKSVSFVVAWFLRPDRDLDF